MAGRGPAPKPERRRRNPPARGDLQAADGGWQHGEIPKPPRRLLRTSRVAWETWFRAWFAAHWTPEDLPGLFVVISLYDQVLRGEYQRTGELRIQMDTYGITPKGQQDRRWVKPERRRDDDSGEPGAGSADPYRHLRLVGE